MTKIIKKGGDNLVIKVGVLIQKNKGLILIREKSWMDGLYHWNIIKGTFEPEKDRDFIATAKRESREEANASINVVGLLNILYLRKNKRSFIQFNFVADLVGSRFYISPKRKQRKFRKDEDIVEVKMFTKRELRNMKKKDFIGERTYTTIQDWLRGRKHEKDLIKKVRTY